MIHRLALFFLATLIAVPVLAIELKKPAPSAPKPPAATRGLGLKDGDRFIFIGDSITHQCLYTQFVENFFYTRYPHLRLTFRNAGISGDRAADALDRFDDDIAAFKPTIATVLLGMNDGSYKDFDLPTFQAYERDMLKLMGRLDAIKCRVILMSPTMFDHQAWDKRIAEKPEYAKNRNVTNYNAVLAYYGKWAQETARKRGYLFVDLFGPLNTFTNSQRKTDPAFTLIPDAIHPEVDGQFIMAYSLLHQCGEPGPILHGGVKLAGGEWKPLSAGSALGISGEPGRTVSYTIQPRALPWTEFQKAPIGTKLTKSGHQGGGESHVAVGLQAGRYDLIINGKLVGNYDERMLGVHAEIQEDPDSPTCQQAFQVIALNKKRNDEAVHPLRNLYGQRKGKLKAARLPGGDMKAFEAWWAGQKAKTVELEKKADEIEAEIYRINQPPMLKVEIKPGTPPPAAKKPQQQIRKAQPPVKKAA